MSPCVSPCCLYMDARAIMGKIGCRANGTYYCEKSERKWQRLGGAADGRRDAVRPNKRTDLTERNHCSILSFVKLDVQVGRITNLVLILTWLSDIAVIAETLLAHFMIPRTLFPPSVGPLMSKLSLLFNILSSCLGPQGQHQWLRPGLMTVTRWRG